jgi:hypothetical protein
VKVVAHLASKANGPDVFHRLRALTEGDEVVVHYRAARGQLDNVIVHADQLG